MMNIRYLSSLVLMLYPLAASAGSTGGSAGLNLILKLPRTTFHSGDQIPAVVEADNVGSNKPVAASFCANFGFSYENVVTKEEVFTEMSPPSCGGDPFHDNDRELRPGIPLVLDLKDIGLRLAPGRYLLMSSWDSSVVGQETAAFGPRYAPVGSNIVALTIVP